MKDTIRVLACQVCGYLWGTWIKAEDRYVCSIPCKNMYLTNPLAYEGPQKEGVQPRGYTREVPREQ